jgi:chromosome segregation ATPase
MSTETEILAEVEALKARFSDTKSLYREVCALLFFRYGITPTTNKLYQHVRKGTMSTPAEALGKFWDELRTKARVEIDHPDLPEELKTTAAEAIAGIWRQASASARGELEALRIEARAELEQARRELKEAVAAVEAEQARNEELSNHLRVANEAAQAVRTELEAERRAHTGTAARLQELQTQLGQAREQQQRLQEGFSADLAQARSAVEAADERAAGAQRKALLEVEQERALRNKSDKALETMRSQLAQAEGRLRDLAVQHAEEATSLRAQAAAAEGAAKRLQAALEERADENHRLQDQLTTQREQLLQATAQVQATRDLLEQFRPDAASTARAKRTKAVRTAP